LNYLKWIKKKISTAVLKEKKAGLLAELQSQKKEAEVVKEEAEAEVDLEMITIKEKLIMGEEEETNAITAEKKVISLEIAKNQEKNAETTELGVATIVERRVIYQESALRKTKEVTVAEVEEEMTEAQEAAITAANLVIYLTNAPNQITETAGEVKEELAEITQEEIATMVTAVDFHMEMEKEEEEEEAEAEIEVVAIKEEVTIEIEEEDNAITVVKRIIFQEIVQIEEKEVEEIDMVVVEEEVEEVEVFALHINKVVTAVMEIDVNILMKIETLVEEVKAEVVAEAIEVALDLIVVDWVDVVVFD